MVGLLKQLCFDSFPNIVEFLSDCYLCLKLGTTAKSDVEKLSKLIVVLSSKTLSYI